MVIALILATFGAALTGQAGAARVLFAMGRSGVLLPSVRHLNANTLQPSYNVGWSSGRLVGALTLSFERAGSY